VQFIADLRNARARELEEKRINKELANIRFVSPMETMADGADISKDKSSKANTLGSINQIVTPTDQLRRWQSERVS
jgi:hypothetical protein